MKIYRLRTTEHGFSLVELLVGMMIALVGTVVIMQVFSSSEGFKRTAGAGADAQGNGATALYMIEREVRMAGYGLNNTSFLACGGVRMHDNLTNSTSTLQFVPLLINPADVPAGDANTDVIQVSYSTSETVPIGVAASSPSKSASIVKISKNRTVFRNGDLVVSVQPLPGGGTECVLHEITGVPGTPGGCGEAPPQGQSDVVNANGGTYGSTYRGCENRGPDRYNGKNLMTTELDDTNGGQLFNMGPLPVVRVFAVRSGRLTVCNRLEAACTTVADFTPIVDDIVSLKAVFGKDTTAVPDGQVDVWDRVAPTTAAAHRSILAAQIAVVSRSAIVEKPRDGGSACDATSSASTFNGGQSWLGQGVSGGSPSPGGGGGNSGAIDISTTSANWQCFRYKLFQTVAPIRNNMWRPS